MTEKTTQTSETAKLYELSYHIVSSLPEDQVTRAFETIKKNIADVGGDISSESGPVLVDLAYEMEQVIDSKHLKHGTAYFGWIKFVAEAEKIDVIKEQLDSTHDILRYIVLKTEEETALPAEEVASMLAGESDEEDSESKVAPAPAAPTEEAKNEESADVEAEKEVEPEAEASTDKDAPAEDKGEAEKEE